MGMAASQARLLGLTARIHDVEYQAQAIQNAKVQLATESDEAYARYNDALDATTLTVLAMDNSGNKSAVPANFNNLCSRNRIQNANGSIYALHDSRGRLIVEDDIAQTYEHFKNSDAYSFAMYMCNTNIVGDVEDGTFDSDVRTAEIAIVQDPNCTNDNALAAYNAIVNLLQDYSDNHNLGVTVSGDDIYHPENGLLGVQDPDVMAEYKNLMTQFKYALYEQQPTNSADDIYSKVTQPSHDLSEFSEDFEYYVGIFKQIQASNGCVSIDDFRGDNTDVNIAESTEWLQAMVECGKITIEKASYNRRNCGRVSFNTTSPSSDSTISYKETSAIDSKELKKAEAEYEQKMRSINRKDKEYDMSLSKLEAQRKALTTEYDSVKKVIEDNVDRTFGIFS